MKMITGLSPEMIYKYSIFIVIVLLGVTSANADQTLQSLNPQNEEISTQHKTSPLDDPLTNIQAKKFRMQYRKFAKPLNDKICDIFLKSSDVEQICNIPVRVLTPKKYSPQNKSKIGIYIHGGAYFFGSAYSSLAAEMSFRLGIKIYGIEYRLAPEHPYPEGLNDCVTVYRQLVKRFGAQNIVMIGESAGGGLTVATLLKIGDKKEDMPAAIALLSPWADLTQTGDSFKANLGRDPVLKKKSFLDQCAAAYVGRHDPKEPFISPVYAEFGKDFAQTIIISGTRDLLLSNAVRLQREMIRGGVDVRLRLWDGMWHEFSANPKLPQGQESRKEIAEFLGKSLTR